MKKIIFLFLTISFLLTYSCKDNLPDGGGDVPFNPFDTLTVPPPDIVTMPVDSNTFLGLHHYIFSKSCNQPGCHDGSFEPDFRTVESAYNTLVYQPIVKNYDLINNGREPLSYRVTPFEPDQSMLWKRISEHFLPNFERMPSSGNPLSQDEIDMVKNWIDDGAKDIFGNVPELSSPQPGVYGVAAFLPEQNNLRVDTFRIDDFTYNPFVTAADEEMEMWFLVVDMDVDQNYVLGNEMMYNKIQFSDKLYDFSNAVELDLEVPLVPNMINSFFSEYSDQPLPYYHKINFKPTDYGFGSGDVVYMRIFVQDADHDTPTENPNSASPIFLIQYFAFVIQ